MEKEHAKRIKSIRIETGEELHKLIKERAFFRSITIKQWVIEAVLAKIQEENKYR